MSYSSDINQYPMAMMDLIHCINNSVSADLLNDTVALAFNVTATNATQGGVTSYLNMIMHPKVGDLFQLAFLGIAAEFTRRYTKTVISWIEWLICIRFMHKTTDDGYDWLMAYWASQDGWKDKCRNFDCETSRVSGAARVSPWIHASSSKKSKNSVEDRRAEPNPRFIPMYGQTFWFKFKGTHIRFQRYYNKDACFSVEKEYLVVHAFAWDRNIVQELLSTAKIAYLKEEQEKIKVKMIDENKEASWRTIASRNKRPLSSVVTEQGIKEKIIADAEEFLDAEEWCIERGIPWRKGYLLEGVPGSGKTSLIHAIASHLDLDIYIVSLATAGLTDGILNKCLTMVPPGAIVVMEDIDVSMPNSDGLRMNRDDEYDVEKVGGDESRNPKGGSSPGGARASGVTLSGLLNAIDGVGGAEGRILFMTTNAKEKLDPALIRAGRADLCIEFKNATHYLAKQLFKVFYPLDGKFPTKYARPANQLLDNEKGEQRLTQAAMHMLANEWAARIEEYEFSTAALQGMLMKYKHYPGEAVDAMVAWVLDMRAEKERDKERKQESKLERNADKAKQTRPGADTPALPGTPSPIALGYLEDTFLSNSSDGD